MLEWNNGAYPPLFYKPQKPHKTSYKKQSSQMATLLASISPARLSASAPHLLLRALPRIRLRRPLASAPRMSSSSSSTTAASTAAAAADGGGTGEKPVAAPYGSWRSPITADVVSGADKRLGGIALAGDGRLLWIEGRPEEKG